MKVKKRFLGPLAWAIFLLLGTAASVRASAPPVLTYQGRLKESGLPVTGFRTVDVQVCDALTLGSCYSSGAQGVSVVNGVFRTTFTVPSSIVLESGAAFVELRVNGATFSPREMLTANAYAVYSSSASSLIANPGSSYVSISTPVSFGAQDAAGFSMVLSSGISTPNGVVKAKAFIGDGSGLTGLPSSTDITKVFKTGDTMTGNLNIVASTLTLTGANGNIVTAASVTASAFFGDGSHLTGVTATGAVLKTGDFMSGPLTLSGSTLTVTGTAFSVGASTLAVAGGRVGIGTAAPATNLQIAFSYPSEAPLLISNGADTTFGINNSKSLTYAPAVNFIAANAVNFGGGVTTGSGPGEFFVINPGSLNTSNLLDVQQNGASRLLLTAAGNVGVGTSAPASKLHVSSGTLLIDGNAGTTFQIGTSTFVVQSNGGVGIGVSNPGAALDVAGGAGSGGDGLHVTGQSIGITATSNNIAYASLIANKAGSFEGGSDGIRVNATFNHSTVNTSQVTGLNLNLSDATSGAAGWDAIYVNVAGAGGTGAKTLLNLNDAGANRLTVTRAGAVGVGTASPGALLDVNGAAQFGAGAAKSTFTTGGIIFAAGSSVTFSGAGGIIISQSSVTASAFFGDGSHLTGLSGAGVVQRSGDTMSGDLAIDNSTLTVNGPIISTGASGGLSFAGAGTRFMWIPSSAAFRAGKVSGPQWDAANIGAQSVAMGLDNTAGMLSSTIGGGAGNTITGSGSYATIAGGDNNGATGFAGAIGGGLGNSAGGSYSTVPGGTGNAAGGNFSFAAGFDAQAPAQGSFVWADSAGGLGAPLTNNVADSFLVRALGGFDIQSSTYYFTNGFSTFVYVNQTGLAMASGSSITVSGANGVIVGQSSITASAFFGDGSHLTGAIAPGAVAKTGDAMTGPLTMLGTSSITVTAANLSVGGSAFVVKGGAVGVGIASPGAALHVSTSAGYGFRVDTAGSDMVNPFVYLRDNGKGLAAEMTSADPTSGLNAFHMGTTSLSPLSLGTNGATRVFIDAVGNVGVGTTAPGAPLDVNGNAEFGFAPTKSSFTAMGSLYLASGAALLLSGPGGVVTSGSSITASAFFGDASHLVNGPPDATRVLKTGDAMSGSLTIANSTLTVNGPLISTGTSGGAVYSGAGTRFMWVPSSAAIRAGGVTGPSWDPANIGGYSAAFGLDNEAAQPFSWVGGGAGNFILAGVSHGVIAGGETNSITGLTNDHDVISGGKGNTITGRTYAVIAGGQNNSISNTGDEASIGGGFSNGANGTFSTVPGGYNNFASANYTFAAGAYAKVYGQGSFVWADSNGGLGLTLNNYIQDQFLVRAQGGFDVISSSFVFSNAISTMMYVGSNGFVGIGTTSPSGFLTVTAAPQPGIGEEVARFGVGDSPGEFLKIMNGTPTNGIFSPTVAAAATGLPGFSLDYDGLANDPTNGDSFILNAHNGAAAFAFRRLLNVESNGISKFAISPAGYAGLGISSPGLNFSFGLSSATFGVEDQGSTSLAGGTLTVRSGSGGTNLAGGAGGPLLFLAGSGGGTGPSNGGVVVLRAGSSVGGGAPGSVLLLPGFDPAAAAGSVQIGDQNSYPHLKTQQRTGFNPTGSFPACGTLSAGSVSFTPNSTDMAGQVVITAGTGGAGGSNCFATIVFAKAYSNPAGSPLHVLITPVDAASQALNPFASGSAPPNSTSFSITFSGVPATAGVYTYSYLVIE